MDFNNFCWTLVLAWEATECYSSQVMMFMKGATYRGCLRRATHWHFVVSLCISFCIFVNFYEAKCLDQIVNSVVVSLSDGRPL